MFMCRASNNDKLSPLASCISIVLVTGIMLLLRYHFRGRMFRVPPTQSIQLGSLAPMQFSASQLRDATNNFTDPLGSGAFGTVYKVIIHHNILICVCTCVCPYEQPPRIYVLVVTHDSYFRNISETTEITKIQLIWFAFRPRTETFT